MAATGVDEGVAAGVVWVELVGAAVCIAAAVGAPVGVAPPVGVTAAVGRGGRKLKAGCALVHAARAKTAMTGKMETLFIVSTLECCRDGSYGDARPSRLRRYALIECEMVVPMACLGVPFGLPESDECEGRDVVLGQFDVERRDVLTHVFD